MSKDWVTISNMPVLLKNIITELLCIITSCVIKPNTVCSSPPLLCDFCPPLQRFPPPSMKISAPLHEDFCPNPLALDCHFRPPWCSIENSFQPPLVGERLVLKTPSNYNFGETFLLINNNNGQNPFTKCVLYLLNLPPDKSY